MNTSRDSKVISSSMAMSMFMFQAGRLRPTGDDLLTAHPGGAVQCR